MRFHKDRLGGSRWVMKNRFIAVLTVLTLALAGVFSLNAFAQTADDGSGPSEQPSAPMEMGQSSPDMSQSNPDDSYNDQSAQPTEAQPGGPSGEAPATTDQGAGRISMIHGDISTQRGDSGDWSAATLNQPLMTGDKISTANDARTEVQLDYANTVRLGPNTQANVANLTKKNIDIQLSQGLLTYSVSKDSEAEPEIDTPNVSVHPSHHDGVFRIEVQPDGDTIVIVRKGEAQIATPQGSTEVREGQMATIRGTSDSAQYKIGDAPGGDDWDRWNSDRDHLIQNAQAYRHTNRYYTGAQDLDAYGRWRNVPDYGDVWVPDQDDDWAPYRNGNWVYEPYYGWTWVGYEPWGWAPYHYGRWFWYDNAWAWWPGPGYGYRPFWAPAYVSFWGWGGGWGFGVGFGGWGGFGWLPIGPCDWFHPWWGGYGGRFGVVNITNVNIVNINRYGGIRPLHGGNRFSNINNIHNNHIFRAMSTMNAGHFGGGKMRPMPVTRTQLNGARMMAGNLPVVPTRASLSASGRAAAPSTIRSTGSQRIFGAHNNVARPVSFQQQTARLRQTMQQNHVGAIPAGGRMSGQSTAMRSGMGAVQKPSAGTFQGRTMSNPVNRTAQTPTRNGYSPFSGNNNGRTAVPTNSAMNRTAQPVNRGGFRPFTPPSSSGARTVAPPANSGMNRAPEPVNRGGFRPFTPPSSSTRSMGPASGEQRSMSQPAPVNRGGFRPFNPPSRNQTSVPAARANSGNYWNRTAPSSPPRSYSAPSYDRGSSYSRPQLDMRQPIVRGPSYGGNSRPSYGNYGGRSAAPPSYSAPRSTPSYGGGRYSPPSGGGHYSAPSGGGHYSAPSGGGHYSAPSGGGGHSSGGGGGHSSGGSSHGGHR